MATQVDSLRIDGMSPINFEIMLSAVNSMNYYYGNKNHFDARKRQSIKWLERNIEMLREHDVRIAKRITND